MVGNSKIAAFSILVLAEFHTTIGHRQEEADVRIFRGLLNGLVETKRVFKQAKLFQSISNLAEKISIVKDPSPLGGIVGIQIFQMMLKAEVRFQDLDIIIGIAFNSP